MTDNPRYKALWGHSVKECALINNRYMDFVQMRGLISLADDNRVNINLKEIWCIYTLVRLYTIDPKTIYLP